MKKLFLIALVLLFSQAWAGETKTHFFPYKDEAAKDKSFVEFRNRLVEAAEKKDVEYIKSITSESIKFSFGPEGEGKRGFLKDNQLDENPEKSQFWEQLLAILRLGGVWQDDGQGKYFYAPFVASEWPASDWLGQDNSYLAAVALEEIDLLAEPDLKAKIVGKTKKYETLKLAEGTSEVSDEEEKAYVLNLTKATTFDGKTGLFSVTKIRRPIDLRAAFAKEGGQWKMTTFIGGD